MLLKVPRSVQTPKLPFQEAPRLYGKKGLGTWELEARHAALETSELEMVSGIACELDAQKRELKIQASYFSRICDEM